FGRLARFFQMRVIGKKSRAIRTGNLVVVAHVDVNMRMIEGRQITYAHEFLCANADTRRPRIVMEIWNAVRTHSLTHLENLSYIRGWIRSFVFKKDPIIRAPPVPAVEAMRASRTSRSQVRSGSRAGHRKRTVRPCRRALPSPRSSV